MVNHDCNVNCPLGYGTVKWVGVNSHLCPVSGKNYCVDCDVKPYSAIEEDHRVKEIEKKQ